MGKVRTSLFRQFPCFLVSFYRIPFFIQNKPPVLNTESRSGQDDGTVTEKKVQKWGRGERRDTNRWIWE